MEPSILTSTKKALGLAADYLAFDLDITMYVNSALSSLNQLGIGPAAVLVIDDATAAWEDLAISDVELGMVKPYIYLKSRLLFDPPATSFAIDAIKDQIQELEWRLTTFRETNIDPFYTTAVVTEEVVW